MKIGTLPSDLVYEAELMKRLKHPHIITLEDIFSDHTHLYLVMELVTGWLK